MVDDENDETEKAAHSFHSVKSVDLVRTNSALKSAEWGDAGNTCDPTTVQGAPEKRLDSEGEVQRVATHFVPSLSLNMDQQHAYNQRSSSKQGEIPETGASVSIKNNEIKEKQSFNALSHRKEDLPQRIQNVRERSQARVEVIKKLRNLKARSDCTKSTQHSTIVGHASVEVIKTTTDMGQARVEVIKKLRCLKAQSAGTKSTHHMATVGLESGIALVESSKMSETNSSKTTNTTFNPKNALLVEFSPSYYREVARTERDRANKFLVELAKAKAEILRLSNQEEVLTKYNRKGPRQNECSAVAWTTRFWNNCRPRVGDLLQTLEPNSSLAGKAVETRNGDTFPGGNSNTAMTDHGLDPLNRPTSGNRCHHHIEETRQLLEELMQIMNSLSVCSDLSVQLDLRPGVNGWSVHSVFVKQVANNAQDGEI